MVSANKSGYVSSEGDAGIGSCNSNNSESAALALVKHILKSESAGVERLIANGVQITDPLLQPPPIVLAALRGDLDMVSLLVTNGANVNAGISMHDEENGASELDGKRALHFAAWRGSWGSIRILLGAGADPNVRLNL